jgi:hypothetical protein
MTKDKLQKFEIKLFFCEFFIPDGGTLTDHSLLIEHFLSQPSTYLDRTCPALQNKTYEGAAFLKKVKKKQKKIDIFVLFLAKFQKKLYVPMLIKTLAIILKKFAKRVVFSKSYKTFHHHNRSFYRID